MKVAQWPPELLAQHHRNGWHNITGMGGTMASGICTTKYHLEVTDAAGCVFDLEVIWEVIVDPASHVNKQNLDYSKIIAYPNPTSGPLTLEIPEDFTTGMLEIIDIRSGTVHRERLDHPQERHSMDISHLPAGVYHIELYPEENEERVFYGTQVVLSN
jgi:hypothetical protein